MRAWKARAASLDVPSFHYLRAFWQIGRAWDRQGSK
jgi:hypothetical protein